MRHYEIILLINPAQSGKVSSVLDRYKKVLSEQQAKIHRLEDWGLRPLAYAINKLQKAHYILLNIEAPPATIKELDDNFKFSDIIIRHLILSRKQAITEPSPMMRAKEKTEQEQQSAHQSTE